MKTDAVATVRIVWYSVLALALLVGATVVGWQLWPTQMRVEREVMKNSHQYNEAKRSLLLRLVEDYEQGETEIAKYRAANKPEFKDVIKGLENQQEATLKRIREEAKLVNPNEVPDSVRKYLNR